MGDFAISPGAYLGPFTEPLSPDCERGHAWHNLVKSDCSASAVESWLVESKAIFCRASRLR